MNPWGITIFEIGILILLLIGIIITIAVIMVKIIKKFKHKSVKMRSCIIALIINIVLFIATSLFVSSHKTYYKYNDWLILNSNIHTVRDKYGDFDIGTIKHNEKGVVGYYIYTDDGPIMPDHLPHYYYIEYDNHGVVYKVYDACSLGG